MSMALCIQLRHTSFGSLDDHGSIVSNLEQIHVKSCLLILCKHQLASTLRKKINKENFSYSLLLCRTLLWLAVIYDDYIWSLQQAFPPCVRLGCIYKLLLMSANSGEHLPNYIHLKIFF